MAYGGNMRGGMNGPMNGLGVAQLLGSLQGPMRSQPPPERPTLFLQKATPRNLADLRSIRESESGTLLEISEKSEVLMLCMDEEYLGAQKLLKQTDWQCCRSLLTLTNIMRTLTKHSN